MAKKAEPSLLDRIEQLQAELKTLIDQRAAEMKANPDLAMLPIDVLVQCEITRGSNCLCAVSKRLLGAQQ